MYGSGRANLIVSIRHRTIAACRRLNILLEAWRNGRFLVDKVFPHVTRSFSSKPVRL